jgi:hypothetical protein
MDPLVILLILVLVFGVGAGPWWGNSVVDVSPGTAMNSILDGGSVNTKPVRQCSCRPPLIPRQSAQ